MLDAAGGDVMDDGARYYRPLDMEGAEIMLARWRNHSFLPHMHDFYAVSLNYGGRGEFHCNGKRYHALPGTCNLIAPGDTHTGSARANDEWVYANVHISTPAAASFFDDDAHELRTSARFKEPCVNDHLLTSLLARFFETVGDASSLLERESALLSILSRLLRIHLHARNTDQRYGKEPKAVAIVKEFLDSHPEENVSIRDLARLAQLSPHYLVRCFHKHEGMPPHAYQMSVRVNTARRLLSSGIPITVVAHQAGFADQSHMTRCFKRIVGVPPGRYRAQSSRFELFNRGKPPLL